MMSHTHLWGAWDGVHRCSVSFRLVTHGTHGLWTLTSSYRTTTSTSHNRKHEIIFENCWSIINPQVTSHETTNRPNRPLFTCHFFSPRLSVIKVPLHLQRVFLDFFRWTIVMHANRYKGHWHQITTAWVLINPRWTLPLEVAELLLELQLSFSGDLQNWKQFNAWRLW